MTSSPNAPSGWNPDTLAAAGSGVSAREENSAAAWTPPTLDESDAPPAIPPGTGEGEAWVAPRLDADGYGNQAEPEPPEEPEAAYARGLAEGIERGSAEGKVQLEGAVRALQGATGAITAGRANFLRDLEANLSALAVVVAGKIVRREVAADPSLVTELVAHALQLVKPDSPVMVRLNPEDLAGVQAGLEAIVDAESGTIKFADDEELERGSFFVEGPHRIVDGRLDHVLTGLYERLAYD